MIKDVARLNNGQDVCYDLSVPKDVYLTLSENAKFGIHRAMIELGEGVKRMVAGEEVVDEEQYIFFQAREKQA